MRRSKLFAVKDAEKKKEKKYNEPQNLPLKYTIKLFSMPTLVMEFV